MSLELIILTQYLETGIAVQSIINQVLRNDTFHVSVLNLILLL